jgi:hypothetical protein
MKAILKGSLCLIVALAFISCDSSDESVDAGIEPFETYTIEQFLETTSVGGGTFSPDESKLLVHSNENGTYDIYEMDIETGKKMFSLLLPTPPTPSPTYQMATDSCLLRTMKGMRCFTSFMRTPKATSPS